MQQLLWLERLQCHASEQTECARRASAYLIGRKTLSDTGGVGSTSGVKGGATTEGQKTTLHSASEKWLRTSGYEK